MRLGVHPIQQRKIIRFIQARLRAQFWIMAAVGGILLFLLVAMIFAPRYPPEKPAVAQIQRDNLTATGFLVGSQLVLTTAAAVGKQSQVFVTFPDKSPVVAKVLFADAETDVALVRSEDIDTLLKPLPLGNSDGLTEREDLYLIGYPADTLTRLNVILTRKRSDVLEIDAASNPGNTGAPLFRRMDDTVIGMILSTPEFGGSSARANHRAIPINIVERVCREHQQPIR